MYVILDIEASAGVWESPFSHWASVPASVLDSLKVLTVNKLLMRNGIRNIRKRSLVYS